MMVADNTLNDGAYGSLQHLPVYGGGTSQSQATAPAAAENTLKSAAIASLVIMALLGGF